MEVLVILVAFGILFSVPIAVLVIVLVLRSRANKRRMLAIQALAASQGWRWVPEDHSYANRWTGEPFEVGSGRSAINLLMGRHEGFDFVTFDYQYTVSNGNSNSTLTCAVWALKLPVALPWLVVGAEGAFGGRVASAMGRGDLQTESEAFNRLYRIQGYDDRYAMAILHPRMMELLLSAPGAYWRIDRDSLVYWESGEVEPVRFLQRLNLLIAIAGQIPSYVWKDYGR